MLVSINHIGCILFVYFKEPRADVESVAYDLEGVC